MKKFITMLLTFCLAITSLLAVGCGGGDSDTTLQIEVLDKGYGYAWLTALKKEFESIHEGYTVKITPSTDSTNYETTLTSGRTKTDIYFSTDHMMKYQYNPMTIGRTRYDCILASLEDVYETTIPGEGITVGEKVNQQWKEFFTIERSDGTENIYLFPYVTGMTGILVNEDVWEDSWWTDSDGFPNTTDELFTVCDTIKETKVPFVHSLDESYYNILWEQFVAQYEGVSAMDNFWNCIDKQGNELSPNIMNYEGLLKGYEVIHDLLKASNGYQFDKSNEYDTTSAQTSFFNAENGIAMMYNGDWVMTELRKSTTAEVSDVKFVKSPVISALGTKLGITDAELSAIIEYVDGATTTEPTFTSTANFTKEQVIARVREARNINPSMGFWQGAFVPAYSEQLEIAKEFLVFMASDKGLETYSKACGHIMPFEQEWQSSPYVSEFIKNSLVEMYEDKEIYPIARKKHRMFCVGGLNITDNLDTGTGFIKSFAATSASDYRNAQTIFEINKEKVKENWSSTYLFNAGIVD